MKIHTVTQGSPEWFALRIGKVTGSNLKKVFGSTNLEYMDELIAEQLTEMSDDNDYLSDAMQRGIDLQDYALDIYEQMHDVTLIRDGFIECDLFPLLGYSPDGRVGIEGGVEVKCPSSKKHIQYIRQGKLPNDYKWQVLSSFIINPHCKWYDFMSYDPRVSQRPVFIYRTMREDVIDDLNDAVDGLRKFFDKMDKYKSDILFPVNTALV